MASLADLLTDHRRLLSRIKVSAPAPAGLRRVIASMKSAGETSELSEETGVLQRRVATAIKAQNSRKLSKRDLRAICNVFLHSPEPPGRDAAIGDEIVAEIERRSLRSPVLALFNAYLDGFKFDDSDIVRLATQLNRITATISQRDADNWASRARKMALFDPNEAPARLAATVLASPDHPTLVLAEAGLSSEVRARGQLSEAAFRLGCLATAKVKGVQGLTLQRRLMVWAHDQGGKIAFPGSFAQFATALLEPWSAEEPENSYRTELLDMLQRAGGGDPRLHPARWREVQQQAPDAYAVILKWLTRASVMQFLDIVGRSMRGTDGQRMWAYRRAFWTSYLLGKGGGPTIKSAWIAFGSEAASLAREAARETGDNSFNAFGRQYDKSNDHSALIMEIGDLLIVDWSHSAKYNVWKRGDRGRPELFKTSYPVGTLYNAPLKDSHVAPANYSWQKKMAKIIEGKNFFSEKPAWRPKDV